MELKPNVGIGDVLFGMTELEVIAILGEPDATLIDPEDKDQNTVYQYNQLKLRLTFYTAEDNRLLYLKTTHPETLVAGISLIDQSLKSVVNALSDSEWGKEAYFTFNIYFNEERWLMLHEEFGRITQVEMGAKTIEVD
jgi:hypothetical protein